MKISENFRFLDNPSHSTKTFLETNKFTQLIKVPTHLEGHLLDQAYLRDVDGNLRCSAEVKSKYYSDHKALTIMVKKGNYSTYFKIIYTKINYFTGRA